MTDWHQSFAKSDLVFQKNECSLYGRELRRLRHLPNWHELKTKEKDNGRAT